MEKTDKDIIIEARKRFKKCIDADSATNNRLDALDDLRFARLGEQWPDNIRKQREEESRPCLTINRLPSFIRQVVNDARQNKPSIKCHPIDNKGDAKTADILDGIIRNIEASSNADIAFDTAIDCAVSCGYGYLRVTTDYAHNDSFDIDILINRIVNPFSVYADPDAEEGDGSDWRYCFVTQWIPKEEFEQNYPKADAADWEAGDIGDGDMEWEDEDKIRVAEYWKREQVDKKILLLNNGMTICAEEYETQKDLFESGQITIQEEKNTKSYKVTQYMLAGSQVLSTNEWKGVYIPIIPVYGDEINVEGKKYYHSLFRHAKDAQRMLNYWRSTSTELVALAPKAPYIGKAGSFETDLNKWNTANQKTHSFLEFDGDFMPQRQPFSGVPAGALQEAMNASDDMKSIMGMYDASLGQKSNETSGKAIMARQREGDTATFHFIDNMNRAIRQTGRVLVDLIPKVYSKPRVMRIMGEDKTPKNVQVNQPFEENGIERIYDITAGRYDVTVATGPSYTTKREEAVAALTEIGRVNPAAAPVLGDVIIKMMDIPYADKVSKRLAAMLPPNIQKMEQEENGIPEEAQAIVGALEQKVEELQQALSMGQQELDQLKTGANQDMLKIQAEQEKTKQQLLIDIERLKLEREKMLLDNQTKLQIASINHAPQALQSEVEQKDTRTVKRVSIQAPSGQVYEGVIEEMEIPNEQTESEIENANSIG